MTTDAVRIEKLGKEYLLGGADIYRDNFREMITDALVAPLRRFRRLRGKDEAQERVWALKDVSFDVKVGEVVGIIGHNGAGKSTLLKVLSRITEPTEGRVTTRGRVASLLEVGTGFHPELTGRENIFLNGAIMGMKKREVRRHFDEIVAFSEIDRFLDTPVKRYSSGMFVRLAFAVAAHLEPEVLVIDEVLAVGDAKFQKKCLGKMSDVVGEGRTVLFVSHNMATIQQLCERVIWLDHGRHLMTGPAKEVVSAYLTKHVLGEDSEDMQSTTTFKGQDVSVLGIKTTFPTAAEERYRTLVISLDCSFDRPVDPFGVGVEIRARDDTLIGLYSPAVTGLVTAVSPGRHEVVMTFPEIDRYLANGDYVFHLWLSRQRMEKLLEINNAGSFTIADQVCYGSGREFSQHSHGLVKLPIQFQVL